MKSPLFLPGQVIEVRAIGDSGVLSGYYTDHDALIRDVTVLDESGGYKGIYTTLNPVHPDLLARRCNRIARQGRGDSSTADSDIIRRVWLPIDIDPKRPAGISSSDEEHAAALAMIGEIQSYLSGLGWPEPVVADSGNGGHLLYRIDLPNDQESSELVKRCLSALSGWFSDGECEVDTSVYNAARIWKMYGTVSRKGDNVPTRPYRRSQILSVPDELAVVPVHDLVHLASMSPEEQENASKIGTIPSLQDSGLGNGTEKTGEKNFDLASWFTHYGLTYTEKPYPTGRLFLFDDCPFSDTHKDGAYAIQFTNGAIFAGCHHNSCGGKAQRWPELRSRFEPNRRNFDEWKRQNARDRAKGIVERDGMMLQGNERGHSSIQSGNKSDSLTTSCSEEKTSAVSRLNSSQSSPENPKNSLDSVSAPYMRPDIIERATEILKNGDPIRFMLDTFAQDHEGDLNVAECLILSLASRSVVNSGGLHVLVTGESGKGKSHSFDTMLTHLPPDLRLDGRMSDKALFYAEDLKEQSAICLDDVSLSDPMQEILKGVTSSFQKPFTYRTVDKDRKGIIKVIPERCVWWVAKVEGTGDDQVWNRMLTLWIDDSEELDNRVLTRELKKAAVVPAGAPTVSDDLLVCQSIWHQMQDVYVVIPFAERIRFSTAFNRRNTGMLLDMVRSVASLRQYQRERYELKEGLFRVDATEDDFAVARSLFLQLNNVAGGQSSKLTKEEYSLLEILNSIGNGEWTIKELQDVTKKSRGALYRLFHGNKTRGMAYSGILEKCPAVSVCKKSVTLDGISRRANVYEMNIGMYLSWISGCECWLDGSDEGNGSSGPDGAGSDSGNGPGDGFGSFGPVSEGDLTQSLGQSADGDSDSVSSSLCAPVRNVCVSVCTEGNGENTSESENINDSSDKNSLDRSVRIVQGSQVGADADMSAEDPSREFCHVGQEEYTGQITSTPGSVREKEDILSRHTHTHRSVTHTHTKTARFHADEFRESDGVKRGPCAVCGHRWVHYLDRSGIDPDKKLCRKCYSRLVAKETMSFTTLPGVVEVDSLVRVHADLGRCKVCGQGRIEWIDKERGVYLCELCREREIQGIPVEGLQERFR